MTIRRLFVSAAVVLIAASAAAVDVRKQDPTSTTGAPDLIASDLRIDADGKMAFKIRNASPAAINTPFKVDAWLDGYLRQTIQIGGLKSVPVSGLRIYPTTLPFGANEQRNFILQEVKVDLCSSSHSLKVVVDTGGEIAESNESNNTSTWSGPTPCPDLAIKSISKHWQNSMHTEFNAEVVIINQGTGNAGPFGVAAGATSVTSIPSGAPLMYDGLKAGETLTLHTGNAYIPDGISVHVVVDIGNVIKESNENNNVADKSIH